MRRGTGPRGDGVPCGRRRRPSPCVPCRTGARSRDPYVCCTDVRSCCAGIFRGGCAGQRSVDAGVVAVFKKTSEGSSGREKPRRATHVEAMQNSSGSAFCLPPSRIFLHGCLAGSSGGCRAVAIASASSALCTLADRLTARGNGYFQIGSAAPLSKIHRWVRRSAAGEHVARGAGGDRVGGEVRATGAGARGIVVVLVTRAMELREEEREAPTRAPDDGRDGRRFAHRVAV